MEIFEFDITWNSLAYNQGQQPFNPVNSHISLTGKKIFMIQKDQEKIVQLMPLLNEDNEIVGTQIIVDS